ncbi:MAG: BNR-4 repeat-containing protein [Armatimonadota bacterium]
MTRTLTVIVALTAALAGPSLAQEVAMAKDSFEPLMGGCGGVYFLAEPGELVVEVVKRDRNVRDTVSELRALLVSPDREVLHEEFIPDDGEPTGEGPGPPQTMTLRTEVERGGIYALNITVSRDRYGNHMRWGFRTNCEKYIVETARGHRDRRHEEPIVLNSEGPATVTFHPRDGEFNIEVSQTPEGAAPPTLHAADGTLIGELTSDDEGAFTISVPANEYRGAIPWELRLPVAWCEINAGGLTRWQGGDPIRNSCLWTPDPASWFAFIPNRWPLTPYHRHVYDAPGAEGEVALRAHNNATYERTLQLAVEFVGDTCPVELAEYELTLGGGEAAEVPVHYVMPEGGGPRVAHVRITPLDTPEVSTYSTIILHPGEAPASEPLDMPVELQPYAHENAQFGYRPEYPLDYQHYFDPQNRPYMRTGGGIATWGDREWIETQISEAITARPESFEGQSIRPAWTKIAFDRGGGVYLPGICGGSNAILHSADGGRTFAAYEVPGGRGTIDIEQFSGHNIPEGPPPFVRFRRTEKDPDLKWRSLNDLELFVPRIVDGTVEIGEPTLITRKCIGLSAHSGIPSSVVSRGDSIHVAWGEATDPNEDVPGVPTYVATYDRETGTMGESALIGYGPPPNDGHNSPSITMDSDGVPHVLIGTHGRPFQYSRPLDDGSGWTDPVLAGEGLSQTYIGFVCGPDDTLHVVFRLWRRGEEPYPHSSHATLAYQRKRPGEPWEAPRILIRAPFSEYSIFYHRLTIDRQGRLFISYDYWSTHWFYRNDHPGDRRAVIMSPDGGETWRMAGNEDLVGG